MSPQIGYRTIMPDLFAAAVEAAWPILGDGDLSAWLEHPRHPDGLLLRDGDVMLVQAQPWLADWPEGRLFGEAGELRWELRDDKHVHLVLISDRIISPEYDPMPLESLGDKQLLLWGSYDTDQKIWSELRIPKLRYPEKWQGQSAALQVRDYELLATEERPYDSRIVRYVAYHVAP